MCLKVLSDSADLARIVDPASPADPSKRHREPKSFVYTEVRSENFLNTNLLRRCYSIFEAMLGSVLSNF